MDVGAVTESNNRAIETGWRIHSQLADWTGKVDNKASFAVSIESAVLIGVFATSGKDDLFGDLTDSMLTCYRIGLGFLIIAILASIAAVFPQLGRQSSTMSRMNGIIFFGHLRHWHVDNLIRELRDSDIVTVLARQLIAMSEILWRKHRFLQMSFCAAIVQRS